MSVIPMSRPWLRPDDKKFYLRKRTPARYREVAGRAEFKIPLNTRDPKEAKARMAQALATWADMEAQWERALSTVSLDAEGAKALVKQWFSNLRRLGDPEVFGFTGPMDAASQPSVDLNDPDTVSHLLRKHTQEAILLYGSEVTEASVGLVMHTLEPWLSLLYSPSFWSEVAQERAFAVPKMLVDPLVRVQVEAPEPPAAAPKSPASYTVVPTQSRKDAPTLTFHDLWEAWKLTVETKLAPRTIHETKGILNQLEAFLGHNDAARVTKADLVRWRTALLADGKANLTWNNRLSQVGQLFKRAVADERLPIDPTVGLRLDKGKSNPWKPYSDQDTVAILQAARKETSPSLRWAHWVMALSGMRVGEVLQLTGGDIEQDPKSGVWFMAVKHDPENGKASKNSLPRNVPIHPSLIEEGFLAHALAIKDKAGDVTLFPDKKPDKYGRLGGRAWNLVGTWVREVVGIKDPKKAPNHSWRHRMEDELRDADVYEADRDAIIGHARKTVGAKYGERGEPLARLHRGLSKVKLPPGL